jgi:hypothetical protein
VQDELMVETIENTFNIKQNHLVLQQPLLVIRHLRKLNICKPQPLQRRDTLRLYILFRRYLLHIIFCVVISEHGTLDLLRAVQNALSKGRGWFDAGGSCSKT